MRPTITLLFILVLSCLSPSFADILHVQDDYQTIQAAINAADEGDTVLVEPGTYVENLTMSEDIVLASNFINTGDPADIANTIIDGDQAHKVVYMNGLSADAHLIGFTIQNGLYTDGGGIMVNDGGPILENLIVRNNNGTHYGGGIHTRYSNLTLRDVEIYGNTSRDGGGLAVQYSDNRTITLERVVIHDNEADWGGGIRFLGASTAHLTHVIVYNNEAVHGGGINCWSNGLDLYLTNVTIYGNAGGDGSGGGLKLWAQSDVVMVNTIFDSNTPDNMAIAVNSATVGITYTDFAQGQNSVTTAYPQTITWGDGNIFADPLFADADNDDFHLTANSPCVDTGDPNLANNPDGTRSDMGMYYFHQNNPPEVEITYPNGGEQITVSDLVEITWTGSSGAGIDYTVLSYSTNNGADWTEIETVEGDVFTYSWRVPVNVSATCLIRATLTDNEAEEASDDSDANFSINPMSMSQNLLAGWSLISIPLIQDDMSVAAVLGDDFDFQYAVYGYDPVNGHYVPDVLENGKGYFLGIFEDATMDVVGLPNQEESVTFDLVRGWNMLGGPFRSTTALANAEVHVELDGEVETFTFAAAVDSEYVSPIMYNFYDNEPNGEQDWPAGNHYLESSSFNNWRGYWYMCMVDSAQIEVNRPHPYPAPGRDDADEGSPEDWFLELYALLGANSDVCRIGVNEFATEGFDNRFDYPEPPAAPFEDYARIYLDREDWNAQAGTIFNRDMRAPIVRGETTEWRVTVECGQAGEVMLVWPEIIETTPWVNEYTLIDEAADVEVNLLEDYVYVFNYDAPREFIVRVHASLDVEEPSVDVPREFGIIAAYPNPFNPVANLSFTMARAAEVKLEVFNLAGQRAATLVDGPMTAGLHHVSFDARNLESGVYIARMTAAGQTSSRKLMLVK